MSKLSEPFRCAPKGWSESGQQKNLFKQWPEDRLEPYGNPAYEGYGYPAAGYGQSRQTVVGLKYPKAVNPQLVGWENPQPVGQRIHPMGTLNPRSDQFTRAEIAPLMGLGCACQADRNMKGILAGLGQTTASQAQKETQSLKDSLLKGVVPDSIVTKLFDKILADEKSTAEAYSTIQKLKAVSPGDPNIPDFQKKQEAAWGEVNTAKFYAMFLPPLREKLAVEIKAGRVTKPDYSFIKNGGTGIFAKSVDFVRDSIIGKSAQEFIKQGLVRDSAAGLGALGEPITITSGLVIGVAAATLLAAGITAFIYSQSASIIRDGVRAYVIKKCGEPGANKTACEDALKTPPGEVNWNDIAKYGAIGLGALVLIQVLPIFRDTAAALRPRP